MDQRPEPQRAQIEVLGERYALGRLIGRGGMADVYRAADRLLERVVAVKVLRDLTDDDAGRDRFTAEAKTLASLNHPGLVVVLDAGITHERPYLVMELVQGRTLRDLIAERPLNPTHACRVGADVAEALSYVHNRGVIHRDVKPGNLLIGDGGRVKLADFGIARLVGDTAHHTKTGFAVGTAAFAAPEQVTGAELTPAVDVYALGLVLLESLTGVRAFTGTPVEQVLARTTRGPSIPSDLPGGLRELIASMTHQSPAERPTASEVAARLRAMATGPLTIPHAPVGRDADRTVAITHVRAVNEPTRVRRSRAGVVSGLVSLRGMDRRAVAAVLGSVTLLVVIGLVGSSSNSSSDIDPGPASPTEQPASAVPTDRASPAPETATAPITAPTAATPAAGKTKATKPHPKAGGHGRGKGKAKKH